MIYAKLPSGDEIYRGLRRSQSPEWPGWAKIDEHRKEVESNTPADVVELILNNKIKDDSTINAMYAVICKE